MSRLDKIDYIYFYSMFKKKTKTKTNSYTQTENNIIYNNNKETIIIYNQEELKNKPLINWEKNRPPDLIRIKQIKDYFEQNNLNIVPGIISIWLKNNQYVVYDGIHRLMAYLDTRITDMKIIIRLVSTDKEKDIIDDFLNINKSISIPSIYLEDGNELKKLICQNVANDLCAKYPKFVSASRKPFVYNFNRDNLIEFISCFNIDFTKTGIDKLIINELNGLNYMAKDFVIRNKVNYPNKCQFHDFYLWYLDKNIIQQKIEDSLK